MIKLNKPPTWFLTVWLQRKSTSWLQKDTSLPAAVCMANTGNIKQNPICGINKMPI